MRNLAILKLSGGGIPSPSKPKGGSTGLSLVPSPGSPRKGGLRRSDGSQRLSDFIGEVIP